MNTQDERLIVLSAGGTGGHMTPAQALGHDLLSRGYKVAVITDNRGKNYEHMFGDMPMHVVNAGTAHKGWLSKAKGVLNLGTGLIQSAALLKKLKPSVVIGFGGYPSVPGVYAAQKLKIPTIIHEQNAIIGRANAFLAPRADRIALSLPLLSGLDEPEKVRTVITGNPVRPDIAALYTEPYPALKENGTLRILIMGGSLGATVFSEIVPQTLSNLSPEYRRRLHIVQQCREEDISNVREIYNKANIKADLATFIKDVATELSEAHLVISRSGASTVAEVTTAGRPAIFVPYPHHKDQQQKMNADSVSDTGGAWTMTEAGFTEKALLAKMETFLQNPQILFKAAEKSSECGKPDAARKLGNLVTALASGWGD